MASKIQIARTEEPQLRPNAIQLADGQPVINYNEVEPGLYFKLRDSTLCKIGPTHVGSVPPNSSALGWPGNSIGELWLDTSDALPHLRVWTGTNWTTDSDVSVDTDQTLTGQKTFTQVINAEGGINASGQDLFAKSLSLSGTAASAETLSGMPNNVLTTKGYVDSVASATVLSNSLIADGFLSGDSFDGSADVTWTVLSETAAVADTLVSRDGLGGIEAESFHGLGGLKVGRNDEDKAEFSPLGNLSLTSSGTAVESLTIFNSVGGSSVKQAIIKSDGSAEFTGNITAGNITADNITLFKDRLKLEVTSANTIAQLRTAILAAVDLL